MSKEAPIYYYRDVTTGMSDQEIEETIARWADRWGCEAEAEREGEILIVKPKGYRVEKPIYDQE